MSPSGAEINEATGGKVDEDDLSGNGGKVLRYGRDGLEAGGNGLRYGMAGLKAAMAVSGSTASHFTELARARQANAKEVATEHKAICRAIIDDQAGALKSAHGPKAKGRTYLAMLNAEGVFSVMHGLQWWAGPPGGARNQCGKVVAFEGEVQMGTNVPNLWRFEEPDEQLLRLQYPSATRPAIMQTGQTTSTIVPQLPQMPEEPAGHHCAGASSLYRSSGRPCFWITRTQAQPSAGSWTL
jgi:hypothetical protein